MLWEISRYTRVHRCLGVLRPSIVTEQTNGNRYIAWLQLSLLRRTWQVSEWLYGKPDLRCRVAQFAGSSGISHAVESAGVKRSGPAVIGLWMLFAMDLSMP